MPSSAAGPESLSCSATASTAGTIDGAGMHRPALEGVVEVLAVGGRAVDEGRAGGAERPAVADGGGRAGIRPGGERGLHVVGAARDDAQADDVDQQPLAGISHRRRQAAASKTAMR